MATIGTLMARFAAADLAAQGEAKACVLCDRPLEIGVVLTDLYGDRVHWRCWELLEAGRCPRCTAMGRADCGCTDED